LHWKQHGSIDTPVNPISFALSAGATFVARAIDSDAKNLQQTLLEASRHRGASFVEIYQNCHIFNDGEFKDVTVKGIKENKKLQLINGEPLVYGGEEKKVLIQHGFGVKSIPLSGDKLPDNAIIHDESDDSDAYSYMLSCLNSTYLPVPVGVFKKVLKPSYEESLYEQRSGFIAKNGQGNLSLLLEGQHSWTHN
jgi:2-oxoglutarate ferredoxin oxidoreductase subunit beta